MPSVKIRLLMPVGYTKAKIKRHKGQLPLFKMLPTDNKDELTALQFIYSKPHGTRHLTH